LHAVAMGMTAAASCNATGLTPAVQERGA
jgi:hypothetical protein